MSAKITRGEESEVKEGVDNVCTVNHSQQVHTNPIATEKGGFRPLKYTLGPRSIRVRELMGEVGWSCVEVGKMLGRSAGLVRSWTCGLREPPDHTVELLEYKAAELRSKSSKVGG